MNKHGSEDLGSQRQGALSNQAVLSVGWLSVQRPLSSVLSPKDAPQSLQQGGHGTPVGAQSSGQFSGEKVASPSPILSSHVGPHWPHFSPGTTLGSSSQGHVESPYSGSGSLHSVPPVWVPHSQPCPGPSPPVRLDSARHEGQALLCAFISTWASKSAVHPCELEEDGSWGRIRQNTPQRAENTELKLELPEGFLETS